MAKRMKSAAVLLAQNNITKENTHVLKARIEAEKLNYSGLKITEEPNVRSDPVAHKEYIRIIKLLRAVGKDDKILEAGVNSYCVSKSEIARLRQKRCEIEAEPLTLESFKMILSIDRQILKEIDMRLAFERQNGFTIMSAGSYFPVKGTEEDNQLAAILAE